MSRTQATRIDPMPDGVTAPEFAAALVDAETKRARHTYSRIPKVCGYRVLTDAEAADRQRLLAGARQGQRQAAAELAARFHCWIVPAPGPPGAAHV